MNNTDDSSHSVTAEAGPSGITLGQNEKDKPKGHRNSQFYQDILISIKGLENINIRQHRYIRETRWVLNNAQSTNEQKLIKYSSYVRYNGDESISINNANETLAIPHIHKSKPLVPCTATFNALQVNQQNNENPNSDNSHKVKNTKKVDLACRICYEGENKEPFVSLCRCTGTLAAVHVSCMERWLNENGCAICELCKTAIPVTKKPKSFLEYISEKNNNLPYRKACYIFLIIILIAILVGASFFGGMLKEVYDYFYPRHDVNAGNDLLNETSFSPGNESWNSTFRDLWNKDVFSSKSTSPVIADKNIPLSNNKTLFDNVKEEYKAHDYFMTILLICLVLVPVYFIFRNQIRSFIQWRNQNVKIRINLNNES